MQLFIQNKVLTPLGLLLRHVYFNIRYQNKKVIKFKLYNNY